MRKRITILLITGSLLTGFSSLAQQRPVQSLYMFDPLLINPAYAGAQVQLSATAIYRNQWVNLEGSPKTFTASIHSGFYQARMGLGIIMTNDVIGVHNDFSFYGVYSYKIKFGTDGVLSFGLQGGFNNLKSDFNKLTIKNVNDPNLSGVLSRFNPNVGAGIFLRQKSMYAGISCPQIISNSVFDQELNTLSKQKRYYYASGGFSKKLTKDVTIIPSILLRLQDDAPLSFDINSTFVFYNSVGVGVSYRLQEGVVGLFELQLNENFHVGYAYDFTATQLNQFSNGTHEIMVNYRVKIPRLHEGLPCPSYW